MTLHDTYTTILNDIQMTILYYRTVTQCTTEPCHVWTD